MYMCVGDEGQSVLVVSVPSFDLTHSAVLLRLGAGEASHKYIRSAWVSYYM